MKKKLTAAVLSVVMLLMSGSVFAAGTETAEESKYSETAGVSLRLNTNHATA